MKISASKYLSPIQPSKFYWVGMFIMCLLFFGIILVFKKQHQIHQLSQNVITSYSDSLLLDYDTLASTRSFQAESEYLVRFQIGKNVRIKEYFNWMDSLTIHYDSLTESTLSELHIVHANPWIMTRLISTDYYFQKELGNQISNQREMVILHKEDSLSIPSNYLVDSIMSRLNCIALDVNIPEYTLRILENDTILFQFPVRVGKKGQRYLPYLNREIQMETVIGEGQVIEKLRDPIFINFKTGKQYKYTQRDDGFTTRMPIVPALIPEINGLPSNQVIHATTNPITLGKPYSHGCIGIGEPAAWIAYYHCLRGTPVSFRYDLWILDDDGDSIKLEDVYELNSPLQ